MHDMRSSRLLATGATWVGLGMVVLGFWLYAVLTEGLLSFVVWWIGWILTCIPRPLRMLFKEKDEALRRYQLPIVGSWILLLGSAIASTVFVVVSPPNWDMWTGIGKDASESPYMMQLYSMLPAGLVWIYAGHVEQRRLGHKYLGERLGEYLWKTRTDLQSQDKERKVRSYGMTLLVIWLLVCAVTGSISGLLLLSWSLRITVTRYGAAVASAMASISLLWVSTGIADLFLAFGVWNRRKWAWTWTLGLEVVAVLSALFFYFLLTYTTFGSWPLYGIVTHLLVIYYLYRPHVKAYFGRQ